METMRARLAVQGCALALLLSGCPSGSGSEAAAVRPPASPDPTPLDSVRAENSCPVSSNRMRCIAEVSAELDADGKPDRFVIYADHDASGRPRGWHADALLASGRRSSLPIDFVNEEQPPGILGAVDADKDGRAEVFVQVDQGASTSFVALFHVVGDQLERVKAEKTEITFGLGGSVTHGAGIECREVDGRSPPELIASGASSEDGKTYPWAENIYRWSAGNLTLWKTIEGTLRGDQDDPEFWMRLSRFYELHCLDLEVGQ